VSGPGTWHTTFRVASSGGVDLAKLLREEERYASRFFLLQFSSRREMNVVEELREREPQPYYALGLNLG
jgi:hypothetical protein